MDCSLDINKKLEIIIVTYNRKDKIKHTLEQLLDTESPVKNIDITVLDNCSTDGSSEIIESFAQTYENVSHVIQPRNIGGCANIVYAYAIAKKEYVWVICDDDDYKWRHWDEIETAINQNFDVIFTQCRTNSNKRIKNTLADVFYAGTFLPACIYKTSHLTYTTMFNMFENCSNLFSHIPIIAKVINENGKIFIPKFAQLVKGGKDITGDFTRYTRGLDTNLITKERLNLYWAPAYFSSIQFINDRKKQIQIIDGLRHGCKSLYEFFYVKILNNKIFYNNEFSNYQKIFKILSFKQKVLFIVAYINTIGKLFNFNTKYLKCSQTEKWIEYFKDTNVQETIDKIAEKYKDKKIIIYGAGLVFNILNENYDLNKLFAIAICDKKFTEKTKYKNFIAISPKDLQNIDFDVIVFMIKKWKHKSNSLYKQGLKFKTVTLIKDTKFDSLL